MPDLRMDDFRLLRRQITWDMVDHGDMPQPDIQRQFGLAPASPDVSALEHEASDARLNAVRPILDRINLLSAIASAVAHRAILDYHGLEDSEPCEDCEVAVGTACQALASAVIAALLSDGLITLNPEGRRG